MKNNLYIINTVILTAIAVAHLLRFVCQANAEIAGNEIALWVSPVVTIVLGYLAWVNWMHVEHKNQVAIIKLISGLLAVDALVVLYMGFMDITFWSLSASTLLAIGVLEIAVVAALLTFIRKN